MRWVGPAGAVPLVVTPCTAPDGPGRRGGGGWAAVAAKEHKTRGQVYIGTYVKPRG